MRPADRRARRAELADAGGALVDRLYELDVIVKIGLEALYGYPERILCVLRSARRALLRRCEAARHPANGRRPRCASSCARRAHHQRARARRHRDDARGGRSGRASGRTSSASRRRTSSRSRCSRASRRKISSELGLQGGPGENAIRLAALARDARLRRRRLQRARGARPQELLRRRISDAHAGDSPGGRAHGDQKRVMTPPRHAPRAADYIVVGRPIVEAPDMRAAAQAILADMVAAMTREPSTSRARSKNAARCSRGTFALIGTSQRSVRAEVSDSRRSAAGRAGCARTDRALSQTPRPTVVVSAAVGGIVLGYEVARSSACAHLRRERSRRADVAPRLRSRPDDVALVVEDVVTTGGSVKEVLEIVRASGARMLGLGVIVRREPVEFGVPTVALVELPIASFAPEDCPSCKAGQPITEPGSRFLR